MYEKHGEIIEARAFMEALQGDFPSITLNNCTIEGVVDLFFTDLERDKDDRVRINKALSCVRCTFKNVVNFRTAVCQEEVNFRSTVFEADLYFDESTFQRECGFREATFRSRADFHKATFHKSASFWRAKFHNVADFHQVQFLDNAVFHEVHFQSKVNFRRVFFQQTLDCTDAHFSDTTAFNRATFLGNTRFTSAKFATKASYRDVNYISNTITQLLFNRFSGRAQRPTEFYLDSQHVDEVENPFFKRYVADQQLIRAFHQANPVLAHLWRWSSDYGRSLGLWAFWSLFFAFLFALAYMPRPTWMQDWTPRFHQTTGAYSGEPLTFWNCFYFSIVTFTTLGFGDVVADNALARFLVTLEVIFGYLMLGGLISIFANKLASRS